MPTSGSIPRWHRHSVCGRSLQSPVFILLLSLTLLSGAPARAQDGPLGQFLKDLFGSGTKEPKKLDLIDRHAAAASRELTRSLEQCDSLIATAQWDAAIRQLQHIVELPEDALVLRTTGWASIKRQAEEKLLSLPEEGRRFYLNQYEQVAHVELLQARARNDFEGLCRVAARFRLTKAGHAAADEVASLLSDAGDSVAAAQWYLELDRDKAVVTTSAEWKSRVAGVFQRLGQPATAQRFESAGQTATDVPRELSMVSPAEWTEVYGGPTRLNSVHADQPLLLEEWSAKSTHVPVLQEDIERRQEDLFAEDHRPFAVANAVAARGMMAVRTVSGLEVRDVSSGRLLWKTRGRNTVESLVMQDAGEGSDIGLILGPADNHEGHPLSSFFYRDAVIGQISTDGRRIFAVGRKSSLLSSAFDLGLPTDGEQREERAFNTIVALDLESGRTLWTTGGSTHDAPFEAPLSGVYFFGPPTVDGNDLFVIGAAGADVNLYCLEASTGLPRWKQFIAQYDSPKIEDDFVRQMWACTPLVTRGLVYCPTNSGWLVAVDRHRRRLAWVTRYSATEVSDRYQPQYTLSALNERWAPTAPILSGGELIFAPPELPDEPMLTDPHLFRVDAVTGKVVFRRGKADSLAVGGVYGETVVIIGRRGLEGWPPLDKWSNRWSTPYPDGLTPCGFGLAINGVYWMPFLEGAVVGFRLSDGSIQETLRNEALAGRLGNLIVHRDRILSAGPTGVVGLWQKAPFETQLNERLAKNPRDPESRLRKARALFSNQKVEDALAELDTADLASGPAELVQEARDLQWKCLTLLLSDSRADDEAQWKRLEELADSQEQKHKVARMQIDRALSSARWQDALDRCWSMTEAVDHLVEDGGLQVRGDLWLSGRLLDLWTKAPEDVRSQLTVRIDEKTKLAKDTLATEGPRLERLFGFHPLGRRLSLQLGVADADQGDLAVAESRLLLLAKAPEPETAVAAISRLTELYAAKDSPEDAARIVAIARRLKPETSLPEGTTLKAWLERQPAASSTTGRSPMSGWHLGGARITRLGAEREFEAGRSLWIHGRPSRWMSDRRLEFAGNWYGLSVLDRAGNRQDWTMPLSANGMAFEEWSPEAIASGNVLALCTRGMLHVCSPIDRTPLWSWALPPRFSTPTSYGWAEEQLSNQPVRSLGMAVSEFQNHVGDVREGPLMAIAGGALVLLGQRELIVFDLRTGEELWRRDGMAASAALVADQEAVCVSATTAGPAASFRLRDGRQFGGEHVQNVFKRTFSIEGDAVLTRLGLSRFFTNRIRIVSERPHSGDVDWVQSMSPDVLVHRLPGRELVAIEPSGQIVVIDVETGQRTDLGRVPLPAGGPHHEMHVLADADRIYVAVHHTQSYDFSHVSIANISLNGDLHAFDRRERKLSWSERISEASLITARFADLPVVILAEQGVPPRRRGFLDALNLPELKLRVLDKRTGSRVAEWSGLTQNGGPAAITVDPARQRIDLFLNHYSEHFNDRLRLQFAAPSTTAH